jgi:SAM-dependent methyltransferase
MSPQSNMFILQGLVFVAILAFVIRVLRQRYRKLNLLEEGFDQRDAFVLKQNSNIYDDFYCGIYDTLFRTASRSQWELMQVLKMTEPSMEHSVFLDIGSGCGYKVEQLRKAGYQAYGVELSSAMVDRAHTMFPQIQIQQGDVREPMIFEKSTFSHVLCTHFTIYEMENKLDFFRNCYSWMIPNGYLILHLVDPVKFNAVVPVTKNQWHKKDSQDRLADTLVNFYDFNYHAKYTFSKDIHVEFCETFTDKATGKVRKNEQTLYMESITDILNMANLAGFLFHGKVTMKECNKDENQYLFVLERMM